MSDPIKKIAADLARRIRLSVTKAIIESVVDSNSIQMVKIDAMDGEVFDSVERLQSYGLTSNPPAGSEALVAEVGGSRDNPIIIIIENSANRPKNLKSGEVAFWCKKGQSIKHNENGETEYNATTHKFNGGGRQGARKDDQIKSSTAEDSAFWAWADVISAFCATASPKTLTGKIIQGSSSTELPND